MVGIVITCWNERKYIRDAVLSALDQTVKADQIVVVDDGSRDCSMETIADLAGITRLSITNRGLPAARTAGVLALDTEWVIFLDGDDRLAPNFVEEMLAVSGDADLVYPLIWRDWEIEPAPVLYKNPTVEQAWEKFPGFGCFMVRRELVVQAGGIHPFMGGEQDHDFLLDACYRGARFAYSDKTWFHYRKNLQGYTYSGRARKELSEKRAEMDRHHPPLMLKSAMDIWSSGQVEPEYLHQERL